MSELEIRMEMHVCGASKAVAPLATLEMYLYLRCSTAVEASAYSPSASAKTLGCTSSKAGSRGEAASFSHDRAHTQSKNEPKRSLSSPEEKSS